VVFNCESVVLNNSNCRCSCLEWHLVLNQFIVFLIMLSPWFSSIRCNLHCQKHLLLSRNAIVNKRNNTEAYRQDYKRLDPLFNSPSQLKRADDMFPSRFGFACAAGRNEIYLCSHALRTGSRWGRGAVLAYGHLRCQSRDWQWISLWQKIIGTNKISLKLCCIP